MSVNPARQALGQNVSDSGLNESLDNNISPSNHLPSNQFEKVLSAIQISTPLFVSCIEDGNVESDTIAETIDRMLSALKAIVDRVEAELECNSKYNVKFNSSVVYLAVQVVSRIWKLCDECPISISEAIIDTLESCQNTLKVDTEHQSTLDYAGLLTVFLIKRGRIDNISTELPLLLKAVEDSLYEHKALYKISNRGTDGASNALYSSATILYEILEQDYMKYCNTLRSRNDTKAHVEFDILESIRRHNVISESFFNAIYSSAEIQK